MGRLMGGQVSRYQKTWLAAIKLALGHFKQSVNVPFLSGIATDPIFANV